MTRESNWAQEEAVDWVVRLRHGSDRDWAEFASWLEADEANRAAYDEAALVDADLGALAGTRPKPVMVRSPQARPALMGRRRFAALGLSAIAVVGAGLLTFQPASSSYAIETEAGQRRTIALADGSHVAMNGSTRLVLDRERPRFVRLESGEALFTVVSDPDRRFTVEAQRATIRNLGTVFNVTTIAGVLEVGVAEGAILYTSGNREVQLTTGMVLRESGSEVAVAREDPESVTGWTQGTLSYSSAPVSRIAVDLSRNLGVPITVSPSIADSRFSGVIRLEGDTERDLRRASLLLGVETRRTDRGWILAGPSGAPS